VTAAQLLGGLAVCTPSEPRAKALDSCGELLTAKLYELPAPAIVALAEAVASVARSGWKPQAALRREISRQLDMRRYDLEPGKLWRAVDALKALGASDEDVPKLEPRDMLSAAKKPRRKGSVPNEHGAVEDK
ncbi:unnamed protein product, partial [Polarella glacialis]